MSSKARGIGCSDFEGSLQFSCAAEARIHDVEGWLSYFFFLQGNYQEFPSPICKSPASYTGVHVSESFHKRSLIGKRGNWQTLRDTLHFFLKINPPRKWRGMALAKKKARNICKHSHSM